MIIQSKNVYFEEKLQALQIEIEGKTIKNIYPYNYLKADVDYGDNRILPGFVDIHNHGYYKKDCNNADEEWLNTWTSYLPKEGVTSTLFAFSCGDFDRLFQGLKAYRNFEDKGHKGTQILGAYTEGPFVGKKPGAQSLNYKLIPTPENIDIFNKACGGRLIYVMIAPEELNGQYDVIHYARQKGMVVALGHTGATYDICKEAIEHGARSFTHTYNGMSGLHHREPGVVGAAMYHDECYAELICDGVHVSAVSSHILAKTKGKDRLIFVTDSVSVKGFKPGIYKEKDTTLYVDEEGHVTLEDGTICGSTNRYNKILKFAIEEAKIDPVTAYNACAKNQCELLNIKSKGLIKVHYDADLVVLDDQYEVVDTYILGESYK